MQRYTLCKELSYGIMDKCYKIIKPKQGRIQGGTLGHQGEQEPGNGQMGASSAEGSYRHKHAKWPWTVILAMAKEGKRLLGLAALANEHMPNGSA